MKKKIQKPIVHRLRLKNGSRAITIPAKICNKYGYKSGDLFEIRVIDEDTLNMKKLNQP
jgi:bifunctional DNA-binding transcriptional regulator/antitoxin component of YhaV-PrlF toxin-antitoxin module